MVNRSNKENDNKERANIKQYKKSNKRVFFDDLPYAHMYVKDDNDKLVRLVETQPLSYLSHIITNIEQTKDAVQILTDLTESLLQQAKDTIESGVEKLSLEDLQKVHNNVSQILNYKSEISKITKTAPADIDNIKTLIDRLLQDSQEEARALIGDRPKSFREDAADIYDEDAPEIIYMEG